MPLNLLKNLGEALSIPATAELVIGKKMQQPGD